MTNITGTNTQPQPRYKINRFYSRQYPIYMPEGYDLDYTTNYGWHHNLMSSQVPVPMSAILSNPSLLGRPASVHKEPPPNVTNDQEYIDLHMPFAPDNIVPVSGNNEILQTSGGSHNPIKYRIISIFITSIQIQNVLLNNIQSGSINSEGEIDVPDHLGNIRFRGADLYKYASYVFFLQGNRPNDNESEFNQNISTKNHFFNGSFVGFKRPDPQTPLDTRTGLVSDH